MEVTKENALDFYYAMRFCRAADRLRYISGIYPEILSFTHSAHSRNDWHGAGNGDPHHKKDEFAIVIQIVIYVDKEGLIERISGMEYLKEFDGYRRLKALQGIRNKLEREIFATITRFRHDPATMKYENTLNPIPD